MPFTFVTNNPEPVSNVPPLTMAPVDVTDWVGIPGGSVQAYLDQAQNNNDIVMTPFLVQNAITLSNYMTRFSTAGTSGVVTFGIAEGSSFNDGTYTTGEILEIWTEDVTTTTTQTTATTLSLPRGEYFMFAHMPATASPIVLRGIQFHQPGSSFLMPSLHKMRYMRKVVGAVPVVGNTLDQWTALSTGSTVYNMAPFGMQWAED